MVFNYDFNAGENNTVANGNPNLPWWRKINANGANQYGAELDLRVIKNQ